MGRRKCVRGFNLLKFYLFVFHNTDTFTSSPTNFQFIRYNKHEEWKEGPDEGEWQDQQ